MKSLIFFIYRIGNIYVFEVKFNNYKYFIAIKYYIITIIKLPYFNIKHLKVKKIYFHNNKKSAPKFECAFYFLIDVKLFYLFQL